MTLYAKTEGSEQFEQLMPALNAKRLMDNDNANKVESWLPSILAKINKAIQEFAGKGYDSVSVVYSAYSLFGDNDLSLSDFDTKMPIIVKEIENGL